MSFFILGFDKSATKENGSYIIVVFLTVCISYANNFFTASNYTKPLVKETYKSQVYDVKNKTFVSFAFVKRKISMVIARLTKEKLSSSLLELY